MSLEYPKLRSKRFRTLDVEVYYTSDFGSEVNFLQKENSWKYLIPIWARKETVIRDLRRIADWLEKLP